MKDGAIIYNQQNARLAATSKNINNPLQEQLIKESKEDKLLQKMLEDTKQSSGSKSTLTIDKNGLIYLHNLIYILRTMRREIIRIYYNLPISSH